jgi:hypothetical protein
LNFRIVRDLAEWRIVSYFIPLIPDHSPILILFFFSQEKD